MTDLGEPRFQNRISPAKSATTSGPSHPVDRASARAAPGPSPAAAHSRVPGSGKGGTSRSRTPGCVVGPA